MDNHFGGFIWTNHAIKRLYERNIKQGDAWTTLIRPDSSRYAESEQAYIYYRKIRGQNIEVVAKQNDQKEWLVLSVWSKPVNLSENQPVNKQNLFNKFFKSIFNRK